jgi:hypothetical protein
MCQAMALKGKVNVSAQGVHGVAKQQIHQELGIMRALF